MESLEGNIEAYIYKRNATTTYSDIYNNKSHRRIWTFL